MGGRSSLAAPPPASAGVRFSAIHLPEIYGIPGAPAALALSARKAGFGGECRRPAAGSRCVRRLRRSNRPGPPPRLRGGAFVHFPPAESGQKGRRGAFIPRAKCPPEPPVRALRSSQLLHPSPASAAGLRFSPPGDGRRKAIRSKGFSRRAPRL